MILTPIAERDVHFYLATLRELQRANPQNLIHFVFLSFYQPMNDFIRQQGFEVLDPYALMKSDIPAHWNEDFIRSHFKTPPFRDIVQHEQLTFGIQDPELCYDKFMRLIFACETILKDLEARFPQAEEKHILQELAGFLGPLSLYYVGLQRGWNSWMTEPSFYKGRIHLVHNSLFLDIPKKPLGETTPAQVQNYLDEALKNKVVVAATKDAHHYKDMGLQKVFNWTNLKKLSRKVAYKYIFREKQEFDHIGNHVSRYLKMMLNRYRNEKHYSQLSDLPADKKFYYFPFHVQLDFSLTIRSPQWLDQLALIEKILEYLPENVLLLTKEHPASIGCLDQDRLDRLLNHPQFRLLHPMINSHDVLERTQAVVTINSKVGAEAYCKGIPVFTFGKAFYTEKGLIPHFENWNQARSWLHQPVPLKSLMDWKSFLDQVWESSIATELYDLSPINVENFSNGISKDIFRKTF